MGMSVCSVAQLGKHRALQRVASQLCMSVSTITCIKSLEFLEANWKNYYMYTKLEFFEGLETLLYVYKAKDELPLYFTS